MKVQGRMAGQRIKDYITKDGEEPRLYFYMSPYKRSLQTFEALASNFTRSQIRGCQEEVQLREQDFGNFQVWNPTVSVPFTPSRPICVPQENA